MNDKDEEEFLEILRIVEKGINDEKDCPEELIKLAKTAFERTVCIEFFKLYKEFQAFKSSMKSDMKWVKWLICGVFTITVLAFVIQMMNNLFGHFL